MKREIFEHGSIHYHIEIGQNKQDNFDIIDSANDTDIWFHVQDIASCHVILKTELNINKVPHQVLKRCAYLCKINSKAKTMTKCDIAYTTINNVTKTNVIGQVQIKNFKIINV